MPVALHSFSAEYAGDVVNVVKGEWVEDGHELALRFPDSFRSDRWGKTSRGRRRGSGSSQPLLPGARLAVTTAGTRSGSPAPGRYKVVFSEGARRDLDHALDAWDGHEVGGALVGHIDGDTIHVSHVGTQAVDRHRSTVRTEIPVEHCEALAEAVNADWLGDWHTHDRGEGTPSSGDESAWAGLRNSYARDAWLGVVVTPGPDPNWPMCDPRLHAWTVSERGLNATIIENGRSPWAA